MAQIQFCPVLMVDKPKAEEAVKFYKEAFGALELERRNSEWNVGGLYVKLQLVDVDSFNIIVTDAEPYRLWTRMNPFWASYKNRGSTGCTFYLLTGDDVEATMAKAVAAGGVRHELPSPHRVMLEDPFGYIWFIRPAIARARLSSMMAVDN